MNQRPFFCALVCTTLLSACGYTDEGDGTQTLFVEARVRYHAGNGRTSADIRVEKDGNHVGGANVTLTDGDTDDVLDLGEQGNRYTYDQTSGFHRRLALRIEAGDDRLSAQLEGPGVHIIDSPVNGAQLVRDDLGDELSVEWTVEDGIQADLVRIVVGGEEYQPSDDNGSFDRVRVADIDPGSQEVHLERSNSLSLTGGTARSTFEMIYDADNDFVMN